nr:copia protein [Tanacetum cinerariifolium]
MSEADQMKLITKRIKIQFHSSQANGSGVNEGTGVSPRVPDVPTFEQTKVDNDDDDFVHPNLSTFDEEERHKEKLDKEEEGSDQRTNTHSHFESTDDEAYNELTQGAIVEEEKLDEEKTYKEEQVNKMYNDVNINLEGKDTEMTDALLDNVQATQVIEDTHVIMNTVTPEVQQQSSFVSSGFISKMHNPNPDTSVDSILNLNIESTSLVDVHVTTNDEIPPSSITTLLPPPIPLIQPVQQTSVTTPTIAPISSIPDIVDKYLANQMNEAIKAAIQLQSDRHKYKAKTKNEEFINKIDENIKKIIEEQVKVHVKEQVSKILSRTKKSINELLEAKVLIRSSNKPKTSHVIAANLSELELKKILIDKIENNKSIDISVQQKTLYKALVVAYETKKDVLTTYEDTVTLKRCRDDKDENDEPSAGSNRGSKITKARKEPESTSAPKDKTSKSTGLSKERSKSKTRSTDKSAQADEQVHMIKDLEEPSPQEFETSFTIDHPIAETTQLPNWESARDVYSQNRIITIKKLEIVEWHNYKHLDWIIVRRDDDKLYTFKEVDYNRLRLQDIEDMLLFLFQGKLKNLNLEERLALGVSLRMFSRSIVIKRRVEDLQLGIESYQKKLNLTKPDTYRSCLKRKQTYTAYSNPRGFIYHNQDKKHRLMLIDKLYNFSDGTLNDVWSTLDDIQKQIRMKYLSQIGNPQQDLKDKGVIDSGCSRHITGNRSYLTDYEEINGEFVAFGDFKLTDESHVLLKVPRKDNLYNVDLKNVVPQGGCSTNSKAFRVFNNRTKIVEENLHVKFIKNTPNIAGSGPNWLFDIDALTKSMNYKSVVAGNQSNGSTCIKACDIIGRTRVETVPDKDYILLKLWTEDSLFSSSSEDSPGAGYKPSGEEKKKDAKDLGNKDSEVPSTEEPRLIQEKDSVNSTNRVNAVSLTVNAASNEVNVVGRKSSIELLDDPNIPELEDISIFEDSNEDVFGVEGSKWVFRNKLDERGIVIRNKEILVAQRHTQKEGIDYDEVFAPVVRIEAIRLFLAYASFKDFLVYQMDVKSAFLYGKIEKEVYVFQPLGFKDPDFLDKVYKVEKAIYGLHQAPRAWKEICIEFEKLMHKKFQMSSMGELTFFLGLQVKQKEDRIFISQDKYMNEIFSEDSPGAGYKPSGEEEKKDVEDLGNKDSEVPSTEEPRLIQEKDSVNSTNRVNAVSLTVNAASNEVNVVGRKSSIQLLDDLNIPELEDISIFEDSNKDVFGAEGDLNNLESTFQDFLVYKMDVKSAFLYGKIEKEVYVFQSLGFKDPDFLDKVYKVEKAIYGLHQASRAWKEICIEFEKLMHKKFQMSSMGELIFFLGLQVKQKEDRIFISQDKYMNEILNKFGFSDVKTASTPIETYKTLLKDEKGEDCKKQTVVANSTTEAEYVVASSCYGQPTESAGFEEIIDFLNVHPIKYALIVNPTFYTSCVEHFWATANVKNINGEAQLHAKVVNEEMYDSLEKATTTTTSLDAEQDKGNIRKTQSKATPTKLSSPETSLGGGPRRQDTMGDTIAQTRVESSADEKSLGEEDASKQGMIFDIDANQDIYLVNVHRDEDIETLMFDADKDLQGKEVVEKEVAGKDVSTVEEINAASIATSVTTITPTISMDEITLAKSLIEIKTSRPKAKGIVMQEQSETPTPIPKPIVSS